MEGALCALSNTLRYMDYQATAEAPIFVVSCGRSGSSLLRYILDTHPAIYAPPEIYLGRYAETLYVVHAGFRDQRLPGLARLDDPELLASVRASLLALLGEQTRRRGKTVWCEKSPGNLDHLDLLRSLFPEARFLCLYRNPLDTIHSCLEGSRYRFLATITSYVLRHQNDFIGAVADYWAESVAKLLDLERQLPRSTHRVRYEDLVTDPAATLSGLFAFLGLPWQPSLIDDVYKTPHDDGFGDVFVRFAGRIRPDSIGRGRVIPWDLVPAPLRARVDELASELGYGELVERIRTSAAPLGAERGTAAPAREPRWVFETHLPERLRAEREKLASLGAAYRFQISGDGGGAWLLCRRGDGFEVLRDGRPDAAAATTLGVDVADLWEIAAGRLNVVKAWTDGRLVISGERPSSEQIQLLVMLLRTEP